jgi:Ca2+-binding RTX toxin-like protein
MGATIRGPADYICIRPPSTRWRAHPGESTGTLTADATDLNPITFTIVNSDDDPPILYVSVSGASSGNGTYQNVDSLVGGPGDDIFVFSHGVAFGGTLDGGGGVNTLDYSAYTTGVNVNLASGTAMGTSGISNIQNVIGGAGADTLTGDAQDNVFTGGPGKDTITGGGDLDTDTVVETRDASSIVLADKSLTIGAEKDTLSGIETAYLTGGPGTISSMPRPLRAPWCSMAPAGMIPSGAGLGTTC